jgi:hypothetical protein
VRHIENKNKREEETKKTSSALQGTKHCYENLIFVKEDGPLRTPDQSKMVSFHKILKVNLRHTLI